MTIEMLNNNVAMFANGDCSLDIMWERIFNDMNLHHDDIIDQFDDDRAIRSTRELVYC